MVTLKDGATNAPTVQVVNHENVDSELEYLPKALGFVRHTAKILEDGWEPIFENEARPDHLRDAYEEVKYNFSLTCPPEEFITLFNMAHFTLFNCYPD